MINKEKEKKQISDFIKGLIMVNFLKFNKLLYLKGKIDILKSGQKEKSFIYCYRLYRLSLLFKLFIKILTDASFHINTPMIV